MLALVLTCIALIAYCIFAERKINRLQSELTKAKDGEKKYDNYC